MSIRWYDGLSVVKDPDAVIDWYWDWSDWVATGDSVSSQAVSADAGITVDSDDLTANVSKVVLSGGTAGTSYDVTVRVTSALGLVDDRTVVFEVSEQ